MHSVINMYHTRLVRIVVAFFYSSRRYSARLILNSHPLCESEIYWEIHPKSLASHEVVPIGTTMTEGE